MLASGSPARFAEELRQNLTQRPPTCATNDAQMRRNRRTPPSTFLEGCVNMPWLRPQSYYVSTNVKTICYTENHTAFVEAVQLVLEDLESPCQLPVRNPDKINVFRYDHATDSELCSNVAALYPRDVALWEARCGAGRPPPPRRDFDSDFERGERPGA